MRVIEESHMEWRKLISTKGLSEDFRAYVYRCNSVIYAKNNLFSECTTLDKSFGPTHLISEQDALSLVKK